MAIGTYLPREMPEADESGDGEDHDGDEPVHHGDGEEEVEDFLAVFFFWPKQLGCILLQCPERYQQDSEGLWKCHGATGAALVCVP